MSYVFISYNENSRELADRVRNQLDALGMATWVRDNAIDWDQEENAAILVRAIQSASALLIIVPRDESNVERISKDVHYGYQFDKPVLMMRRIEELPTFLQRLGALVPQRTEYSPLPQPMPDDALLQSSFFERYGMWAALALLVSILVAGSIFVFISQQSPPPSVLATLPPTLTASATILPSETAPPEPTLTATVIPPTSTAVAVMPSATVSRTPAPRPTDTPTRLPSATPSPLPSRTPSPVPSTTPLPLPTNTLAPTLTATLAAASPTPLPQTVGAVVSPTLFAPTFTPIPLPVGSNACPPPTGWVAYTVRAGDTLFSIAGRAGSTVEAVRAANCLTDVNVIAVGQTLYLPTANAGVPTPTGIVLVVEGCDAPGVIITAPLAGETLNGLVEVRGTASIADFSYYRLEIRPLAGENYSQITQVSQPVIDNLLWRLDTESYASGIYSLRLTVVTQRGTFPPPCIIPVIFG